MDKKKDLHLCYLQDSIRTKSPQGESERMVRQKQASTNLRKLKSYQTSSQMTMA